MQGLHLQPPLPFSFFPYLHFPPSSSQESSRSAHSIIVTLFVGSNWASGNPGLLLRSFLPPSCAPELPPQPEVRCLSLHIKRALPVDVNHLMQRPPLFLPPTVFHTRFFPPLSYTLQIAFLPFPILHYLELFTLNQVRRIDSVFTFPPSGVWDFRVHP